MDYLFWIVLGYISGSVLYAYWLPKLVRGVDVCALSEDENPGTFNVFEHCGAWFGSLVLLLELGKAFCPVHLAMQVLASDRWPFAFVVAAPVVGHAFPLWRRLRGGKAIAAAFGAALGLYPLMVPALFLAACYLIFSLVVMISLTCSALHHCICGVVAGLWCGAGSMCCDRRLPAYFSCSGGTACSLVTGMPLTSTWSVIGMTRQGRPLI